MTAKQFQNKKWKVGDSVWVISSKNLSGFHINSYRVVEAKVRDFTILYSEKGSVVTSISIVCDDLEENEQITHYYYGTSLEWRFLFTSKKMAERKIKKLQESDKVRERAQHTLPLFEKDLEERTRDLKLLKSLAKGWSPALLYEIWKKQKAQ